MSIELAMSLIDNEYLDKLKHNDLIEELVSKNAKRNYFLLIDCVNHITQ